MESDFKIQISNWLKKIRELPDKQKKIILWAMVSVLALIMGYFWIKITINRLKKIADSPQTLQIFTPNNK